MITSFRKLNFPDQYQFSFPTESVITESRKDEIWVKSEVKTSKSSVKNERKIFAKKWHFLYLSWLLQLVSSKTKKMRQIVELDKQSKKRKEMFSARSSNVTIINWDTLQLSFVSTNWANVIYSSSVQSHKLIHTHTHTHSLSQTHTLTHVHKHKHKYTLELVKSDRTHKQSSGLLWTFN
jgi:hypothetical protein